MIFINIYISSLCIFLVFAPITESQVILLRDYEEEPIFLDQQARPSSEEAVNDQPYNTASKPKRVRHTKQAILHYGRHIYHLDNFEDLTKLRSKISKLKPDYISYDYADINDLIRSDDTVRSTPIDYLPDIALLSQVPTKKICKDKGCDEDLRKFSKLLGTREEIIWKHKKMPLDKNSKRFQIIDNETKYKLLGKRGKVKNKYASSKERRERDYDKKRKLKSLYSDRNDFSSESNFWSQEKYSESWKEKDDYSKSVEDSTEFTSKLPKKKHHSYTSSTGHKTFDNGVLSKEKYHKSKRKKKHHNFNEAAARKKIKIDSNEDLFLQGNRIYQFVGKKQKSDDNLSDEDKRRRLPQFLPKRYHWSPSDIHNLGYFWFNGPRGRYPAPQSLI